MEGVVLAPPVTLDFSFFLGPEVGQDLQGGTPFFKLHLPIDDNGRRYNDEMGAPDALVTGK